MEDIHGNILAAHDWNYWKSLSGCDSIYEVEKCDTTTTVVRKDSISIEIKCDTTSVEGDETLDMVIKCDTLSTTIEYDSVVTNVECKMVSNIVTEEHFFTHKINGKFTPLNMDMINQWFSEHEDAVLVTDKIDNPEKMSSLFIDKDRLYMELFSFEAIEEAKALGINYMMSENVLYQIKKDKLKYLIDNEILAIAISRRKIEDKDYKELFTKCKENNIKVWVFHVNFDSGKDEKYVYENEMPYIYGMYADKWIDEFSTTTSLEEVSSGNLKVYYNGNLLNIKSESEIRSLTIYDVTGALVTRFNDIYNIEFQALINSSHGMLILQVETTDAVEVLKVF